jgi:hypothetical protein
MIDGMVLKMCRNNIRIHIICRMLDCRKVINVILMWYYDNSSRMLAGCSFYSRTAFR